MLARQRYWWSPDGQRCYYLDADNVVMVGQPRMRMRLGRCGWEEKDNEQWVEVRCGRRGRASLFPERAIPHAQNFGTKPQRSRYVNNQCSTIQRYVCRVEA